ncbi:helix-turn-helix transcriptional regulator [Chromobacterium vaccinii]|uniref:AraC family transcriptional regulator n=1 Tax=Chromobacterium vaccinii TaxID=1108595 RepID=A0A1D9LCU4_9NEIS|nr:helix-turn-helix transcriptional regulator [Chromobacterium vaccinii]AOZ49082.1 AraC family transcriptional regulator [Chromobacterium vaccinii]QND85120.1 AraC family transcriptional regulator [Chromobacterium vaccinii]QND90351.1 AraC family transcriptional regulator [Chromobacterium vaccinii]
MFYDFYFPLVSALSSPSLPEGMWVKLRNARFLSASMDLVRHVQDGEGGQDASYWLQLHADLQLAMGLECDAEESYRQACRAMRASKEEMRALSSRNMGWQQLFRRRFSTAIGCFTRLVNEPDIDPRRRVEGMFGIMSILFELGHLNDAEDMLNDIAAKAEELPASDEERSNWRGLIRAMYADLAVQRMLRHAPQLSDHIYWHSGRLNDFMALRDAPEGIPQCARGSNDIELPVLRARLDFKESLNRLANGNKEERDRLLAHLDWADSNSLKAYQNSLRQEIALASLVGDYPQLAEMVLRPLNADARAGSGHRQLETLYCLSKVNQAQGYTDRARQLYSKYAMAAAHCIREGAGVVAQNGPKNHGQGVSNDITARLPAKYRRAYQYLLDNLERSDLSIREIAVEIGVTVRALQNTFRSNLGSTPSEIIRQERMVRIRRELQSDDSKVGQKVREVGNKWGVPNRSTLLNAYKRQFNEAPSQTLNRK